MSGLLLQLAKLLPFLHPKVANPAMTAAVTTIVLWAITTKVTLPPEVAAAIVAVISLAVGYLTPSPPAAAVTTPTPSGGSVTIAP